MASYYKIKKHEKQHKNNDTKGKSEKKQYQQRDKSFSLTLKSAIPFNKTRIVVFTLEVVPPVV